MNLIKYEGQPLEDNQWLVKVRKDKVGFMTKLTKKLALPKPFAGWKEDYHTDIDLEVNVITEDFSDGWQIPIGDKYNTYRIGVSQQWVKIIHPFGFILEVRMENFFKEVLPYLNNGHLDGEYKWIGNEVERLK
jgi:hypothetical protein